MKINTIKNKDPFGSSLKSKQAKTGPNESKASSLPKWQPNPKASLRNWNATLRIKYDEMPLSQPVVTGLLIRVGDTQYKVNFDKVSIYQSPKDSYTYRINIIGLKESEDGLAVAKQPGAWATQANRIILYLENADVLPIELTEFSVATRGSAGYAHSEILRHSKFINK